MNKKASRALPVYYAIEYLTKSDFNCIWENIDDDSQKEVHHCNSFNPSLQNVDKFHEDIIPIKGLRLHIN